MYVYVTYTSIFSTTYKTMKRNRCDKVIMTQALQKKSHQLKKKIQKWQRKFKKRQGQIQKWLRHLGKVPHRQRSGTRKYTLRPHTLVA